MEITGKEKRKIGEMIEEGQMRGDLMREGRKIERETSLIGTKNLVNSSSINSSREETTIKSIGETKNMEEDTTISMILGCSHLRERTPGRSPAGLREKNSWTREWAGIGRIIRRGLSTLIRGRTMADSDHP